MELQYTQLNSENFEDALNCLCRVLNKDEPLISYLKIPKNEYKPYAKDFMTHALSQNLSWVAVEPKNNKIVAVLIATDFENDFLDEPKYSQTLNYVIEFEITLLKTIRHNNLYSGKHIIHAQIAAVDEAFQRQGVATNLAVSAAKSAFSQGYRLALGEVTNNNSLKILNKIPSFKSIHSIKYKDFSLSDGTKPFENMVGQESCVVFQCNIIDFVS